MNKVGKPHAPSTRLPWWVAIIMLLALLALTACSQEVRVVTTEVYATVEVTREVPVTREVTVEVTRQVQIATTPSPTPEVTATRDQVSTYLRFANNGIAVKAEPDDNSQTIGNIAYGEVVKIVRGVDPNHPWYNAFRNAGGGWEMIAWEGGYAFVWYRWVQTTPPPAYPPTLTPTPGTNVATSATPNPESEWEIVFGGGYCSADGKWITFADVQLDKRPAEWTVSASAHGFQLEASTEWVPDTENAEGPGWILTDIRTPVKTPMDDVEIEVTYTINGQIKTATQTYEAPYCVPDLTPPTP